MHTPTNTNRPDTNRPDTNRPDNGACVTWKTDDEGYRFPRVVLGPVVWEAWHSVGERTAWDGDVMESLDVVALGAPDEAFTNDTFDLTEQRALAAVVWDSGSVHTSVDGVTTLWTPFADLTGNKLADAVTRFRP
jgi:hypothetical protein